MVLQCEAQSSQDSLLLNLTPLPMGLEIDDGAMTEPIESKSLETEQKKPVPHEQKLRAPQQQVHQQNL